jgi:peptide-methionine (S)-S-oxide reductase
MGLFGRKPEMVSEYEALPGRNDAMRFANTHYVSGHPIAGPFPDNLQEVQFALGCFWGAERCFWSLDGVYSTAVGYAGGYSPNPTYEETCSGMTGHTEVVLVVYDPALINIEALFKVFWESHDPTQGFRQGNDTGSQYRSAIYVDNSEALRQAKDSMQKFQEKLTAAGYPLITTEIASDKTFYYAEDYHQQYLAKNPGGYCGLGGTGVSYPA